MPVGESLYLTPKMGIVPEVSAQTYETLAKQFREVITNSLDANAKNIIISINTVEDNTYVLFSDDGDGMTIEELKEQYLALGGSHRYYEEHKIGRIGIGFLAIAPLCEYVEIYSRKKGTNNAFVVRLELSKLVDKHLRMKEIRNLVVGEILEEINNANELGLDAHYTKIYIHNVNPAVTTTFSDLKKYYKFKEELRTLLPIEYPIDCRLFENISPELKKLLLNEANKNCINVYLNSKQKLIRRVYGEEKDENFAHIMEIKNEECDGVKIIGYFIDNQAKIKNWNGLVTRVLNVAVEDSGYLGYEGHESAKPRITGELYFLGDKDFQNKAISINRNQFNEGDEKYRKVQSFIHKKLKEFFRPHYQRTYILTDMNRMIKQLRNYVYAFEDINIVINYIEEGLEVIKRGKLELSEKIDPLDLHFENKYGSSKINFISNLEDPKLQKKGYKILWKGNKGLDAEILIDKKIFDEKRRKITIMGEHYDVIFIKEDKYNDLCQIDFKNNKIFLNSFNPLISMGDKRTIIFVILISYCYQTSKDSEEFYSKLLKGLHAL